MSDVPALPEASRTELLAMLAAREATITTLTGAVAVLEARVADLERRLGGSGGGGMPGLKPPSAQRPRATGQPRKRRRQAFVRRRSPAPTRVVTHAAETCPDCGTHLVGGWVHRRREVLELPVVAAEITEHQLIARPCPVCQHLVLPQAPLSGVVLGQQRLGLRLVSYIITLREEQRLPFRAIQRHLQTIYGLHLSLGTLVAACHRTAAAAEPELAVVEAAIRASPAVNLDETGWRQDGRNGYVWTASTPTACCFRYGSRQKGMVGRLLGADFAGVLVSDFYAAYHHYDGVKQKCWAHVLREAHDLTVLYPQDRRLRRWVDRLSQLYADATAAAAVTAAPERDHGAAQRRLSARLQRLCAVPATDPTAVQGRLSRRLLRHLAELFIFVVVPGVPADNNGAERSLRHLVTSRKISGGSRAARGTHTKLVLASLVETWRRRGLNPFHQTLALLQSHQA